MEKHNIYVDESGNSETGFKDKKQLFIIFASHSAAEDACQKTINQKFPKRQSSELKYVNLGIKKRISTCIATLGLLKKFDPSACFVTYAVYKPLFLFNSFLTFFHDDAIEENLPDFNTGNPDFILKRMHLCWFNFLRKQGPVFLSDLIGCYMELISKRFEKEFKELIKLISFSSENGCIVSSLIQTHFKSNSSDEFINRINLRLRDSLSSFSDTTVPCVFELLKHWRRYFKNSAFDVIHDKCRVLSKQKDALDFIMRVLGLSIDNIHFQDSKDYFGLQIADLLAGVVNDFSKSINSLNVKNSSETVVKYFDRLYNFMPKENFIFMIPDERLADEEDIRYIREKGISIYL